MSHNGRHIPAGSRDPRGSRRFVVVVALVLIALGAGILIAGTLREDPTVTPPSPTVTVSPSATPST
jgi:hypothetical protein